MTRYTPEVTNGTPFLAGDGDRLEISDVDQVVAAIGGDAHEVEYD